MRTQPVQTGVFASGLPSLTARALVYRVHAGLTVNLPALDILAGQMLGILGPNGAGKTTLMNLLIGALRPVHGEVVMQQRLVHAMTAPELARRRTVVRAGEDSGVSGLTAREVMELGALSNPIPVRLLHVLISAYAQAFDLRGRLETEFAVLSSGEKKRVEIARALIQIHQNEDGHVLFLDEPFAHLDAKHAQTVKKELLSLKSKGVAIVCILHDINYAAQNCDRIVFIREGRIIDECAARDIYRPTLLKQVYDTEFAVLRSRRSKYAVAQNH